MRSIVCAMEDLDRADPQGRETALVAEAERERGLRGETVVAFAVIDPGAD
jgi:hypothetical protein